MNLPRTELEALHSVLRRACERMERRKRTHPDNDNDRHADELARQVADIEAELAGER